MFGAYSATIGADAVPVIGTYLEPVGHWLIGSGHTGLLAWGPPALSGKSLDVGVMAFFLYMVAFMDTTATIPTGAMAERWKWKSFCMWSIFCGAIYYPLFGAMTWGGGWLGNSHGLGLGYVDFAGSGVVHAMDGVATLAGAMVLGPRLGKFGPDGKARTIAGHHILMAMLGTFILLFGWFGFNAASTFAATDPRLVVVAVNTAIAAAFGAITAMVWAMRKKKGDKPDPGMMANGMLGGLVAITAPCAFVKPWAAALIGILAAVLIYESVGFFERRGIDDPVGNAVADPVRHGVQGIIKGDWGQLGAQPIGCLKLVTVMFGLVYGFFRLQNKLTKGGIRSDELDEIVGLDLPEMGVLAYPEFDLVKDDLAKKSESKVPASV